MDAEKQEKKLPKINSVCRVNPVSWEACSILPSKKPHFPN